MKKSQLEMMITFTEMKNNLQGINNEVDETENKIKDLDDKKTENTQ